MGYDDGRGWLSCAAPVVGDAELSSCISAGVAVGPDDDYAT